MIKKWLRVDDDGKLSHVVEYENGQKVQIPINKDGSIKWLPDKVKEHK